MTLDFDTCYRAVTARDPRFDGRFFTGVTSTGIYCRPICPARTPARRNIRFFQHVGAAEAAGFRACRRCRPEASPGSPDWNVRADLAARALRLIGDGFVDEHGVTGLASRLAVTDRHLRRLLLAELGATPLALARTARLQTARRLLAETAMPITDIAFASGFASIRQFNASFREAYGKPPSRLRIQPGPAHPDNLAARRAAEAPAGRPENLAAAPGPARPALRGAEASPGRPDGRGPGAARPRPAGPAPRPTAVRPAPAPDGMPGWAADGAWLTLRLAYREPFDGASLLRFLGDRAIPGVEEVSGQRYRRTVRALGGPALIELSLPPDPAPDPTPGARVNGGADPAPGGRPGGPVTAGRRGQVLLRVRLTGLRGVGQVVSRCRRLLDLDADPAAIAAVLASDDVLAPLVAARPGLRVPGAYDGFELAVRAVLGQQVSVAAARTFAGRIAARFGERVDPALAGPDSAPLWLFPGPAELAEADLSGLGLTAARQATLRALAAAAAGGQLRLDPGADPEEAAARLAEVPGVGPWTVAYVLMRAAGDPDSFPATDLVLRRALDRLGCPPERAGRWRPWRAYAALHLWASSSDATPTTGPAGGRPGRASRSGS